MYKPIVMNVEAQKLNIIERFMKFRGESAIQEMELAVTRIEMNNRADDSIQDIKQGRIRSFEEFRLDIKEWIETKKNTK